MMKIAPWFLAVIAALLPPSALRASESVLKVEHFDRDPGWEGSQNRVVPATIKNVQQDFDQRATNFAGKDKGEIGGTIWRSSTPASYADKIGPKTLSDRLSASGTFALTASDGSSGVFFGWFKAETPE